MKTAKQHNADLCGESELITGSGLKRDQLERFFESLGLKLTTIKVARPKHKPKRTKSKLP